MGYISWPEKIAIESDDEEIGKDQKLGLLLFHFQDFSHKEVSDHLECYLCINNVGMDPLLGEGDIIFSNFLNYD